MTGVIYARYSSDNQREESIEGQLRECQAFAKKNDITLLEPYIDRALSAKTDHRPNFLKMIRIVRRKSLMLSSYGSLIDFHVIVSTLHTTSMFFVRTE